MANQELPCFTAALGKSGDVLQFQNLPFWRHGKAWYVPEGLRLPRRMEDKPVSEGQSLYDQQYAKQHDLGVLYARALMRFYFEVGADIAKWTADNGQAPAWPPAFFEEVARESQSLRLDESPAGAGFFSEIERWLIHAASSASALMDGPGVLSALTPAAWDGQCAAHLESSTIGDSIPDIWSAQTRTHRDMARSRFPLGVAVGSGCRLVEVTVGPGKTLAFKVRNIAGCLYVGVRLWSVTSKGTMRVHGKPMRVRAAALDKVSIRQVSDDSASISVQGRSLCFPVGYLRCVLVAWDQVSERVTGLLTEADHG